MKNNLSLVLGVFLSLLLLACEQESIPGLAPKSLTDYSLRPTENTWPRLPENAGAIAKNILAENYYIVLDGSGSMSESSCAGDSNKMQVAKEAVIAFAGQLSTDVNLGLYVFDNNGMSERIALSEDNRIDFNRAVNTVHANHGTPLHTSVVHAYRALETQAIKQLGYGEYHLVIVTDGTASLGEDPTDAVHTILGASPIVIHTIGFCIDEDHPLNQKGRTYYSIADNPESLQQGLKSVLAEAPVFKVDSFSGDE